MSSSDKEEAAAAAAPRRKVSCTKDFDALWFCYSPVHQMQQYYRLGSLDNCSQKWNALFACLNLKTKRSSEVEKVWNGSYGLALEWPIEVTVNFYWPFKSQMDCDVHNAEFSQWIILCSVMLLESHSYTIPFLPSLLCNGILSAVFNASSRLSEKAIAEILQTREKSSPPHIWSFRSPEEAAVHWQELFGHLDEVE